MCIYHIYIIYIIIYIYIYVCIYDSHMYIKKIYNIIYIKYSFTASVFVFGADLIFQHVAFVVFTMYPLRLLLKPIRLSQ